MSDLVIHTHDLPDLTVAQLANLNPPPESVPSGG